MLCIVTHDHSPEPAASQLVMLVFSWQLAPVLTVKPYQTQLLTMSVDAVGLQCQEEEQQQATGSLCTGSASCW